MTKSKVYTSKCKAYAFDVDMTKLLYVSTQSLYSSNAPIDNELYTLA
jgi:hypothetical protein